MNENEELKIRYYDFLEETRALNAAIIRDEKRKARKEGLAEGKVEEKSLKEQELVRNMYKENVDINLISKYTNLSKKKIEKIIKSKNNIG